MTRREYHPVQGAYIDKTAPPDPFIASLRAGLRAPARPLPGDCDHEPNATGTACRHCGIVAERADISPDALALLIADQATDHDGTRARWTVALTQADINRRRAIARARVSDDALATVAAVAGIVADRRALPLNTARPASWRAVDAGRVAGDTRQPGNDLGAFARLAEAIARQREAGDVWRGIRHAYDQARAGIGPDSRSVWTPAQYAAEHDAHTERELLAGRADADGRTWTTLPPLYAAAEGQRLGPYTIHWNRA